jgi:hypothetical protein
VRDLAPDEIEAILRGNATAVYRRPVA